MADLADAIIDTTLLDGTLKLRQLKTGHRAGTDAVLLAACIGEMTGVLVDMGAGAGAAGLAIAMRNSQCQLVLAECEPAVAAIAAENIALNGLQDRAKVAMADILSARERVAAGLLDNSANILVSNPPYQDASTSRTSPDPLKARAHTLPGGIDPWIRACAAMLRPGGTLALIHRADALGDVVAACAGRFGALSVLPVFPRRGARQSGY